MSLSSEEELFEEEKSEWEECLKEAQEIMNVTERIGIKFKKIPKVPIAGISYYSTPIPGIYPTISINPEICSMKTTRNLKVFVLLHELADFHQNIFKIILYKTLLFFRSYVLERDSYRYVYDQLTLRIDHDEAKQRMSEFVKEFIYVGDKICGKNSVEGLQERYNRNIKKYMPFLIE